MRRYELTNEEWERFKVLLPPDYTGNYAFGYNGAAYWEGFNLDNFNFNIPHTLLDEVFVKSVGTLRANTPFLTDTERFLLFGAGGAQLISDKDFKNLTTRDYGDNVGDSISIQDGIDDYYCYKKSN